MLEPLTTCVNNTSVNAVLSANKALNTFASILAKASLVGANTVNMADSSDNVVTKSAAVSADTNVEKRSVSAKATSTIFCVKSGL